MQNLACKTILKSGERRGQPCNRVVVDQRNMACNRHRNPNALCTYDPPLLIQDIESYEDDTELTELNGYINIRLSNPFFSPGKLDMVLMSKIKPGTQHFTKASLVKQIYEELQWLIDNKETSPLKCRDISNIAIKSIVYDRLYGIFKVSTR